MNGIVNLNTGQPFTIGSGVDNARTGAGGQRADMISNPNFTEDRTRQQIITEYLRKASFTPNAIGTYGNLGRNTFTGPGLANVNLNVVKTAHIPWFVKEGATVQLRGEIFNLFNRVNLTNVVNDLSNSLFGRSTAQSLPRSVTLGLRIQF